MQLDSAARTQGGPPVVEVVCTAPRLAVAACSGRRGTSSGAGVLLTLGLENPKGDPQGRSHQPPGLLRRGAARADEFLDPSLRRVRSDLGELDMPPSSNSPALRCGTCPTSLGTALSQTGISRRTSTAPQGVRGSPCGSGGHDALSIAAALGTREPKRRGGAVKKAAQSLGNRAKKATQMEPERSFTRRVVRRVRGAWPVGTHLTSASGRRAHPQDRHHDKEEVHVQFGRSYEEFEVGAVYKHWPGKTVTEYDDHLFCLLTMNHHPLHLDANYAENTTQFGSNVVVGNYIYSLLLGMSVPDVSGKAIANLEIESLRHVAPTFHGDTIYGETTVLDKWESKSKDDVASCTSRPRATSRTAPWSASSVAR